MNFENNYQIFWLLKFNYYICNQLVIKQNGVKIYKY